jgi:hypothetical protein
MSVTNGVSNAINNYNSSPKNNLEKLINMAKKGTLSEADVVALSELVNSSNLNPFQLNTLRTALLDFSGPQKNNVNKLIKEIEKKIEESGTGSVDGVASSGLFSDQFSLTTAFSLNNNQSNKIYINSMKAQAVEVLRAGVTYEVMAKILDDKQGLC